MFVTPFARFFSPVPSSPITCACACARVRCKSTLSASSPPMSASQRSFPDSQPCAMQCSAAQRSMSRSARMYATAQSRRRSRRRCGGAEPSPSAVQRSAVRAEPRAEPSVYCTMWHPAPPARTAVGATRIQARRSIARSGGPRTGSGGGPELVQRTILGSAAVQAGGRLEGRPAVLSGTVAARDAPRTTRRGRPSHES